MVSVNIFVATTLLFQLCIAVEDGSIVEPDQETTNIKEPLESCPKLGNFLNQAKCVLNFQNTILKSDLIFYPIKSSENSSNMRKYSELRQYARQNKITFSALEEANRQGQTSPLIGEYRTGELFLLMHGWTDSFDSLHRIFGIEWPLALGEAWARIGKGRVIFIDWSLKAMTNYMKMAARVHLISELVFDFMENIRKSRAGDENNPQDDRSPQKFYRQVHCAGHSLASHIFGGAGHLVFLKWGVKIDIIYALDPAGFWFYNEYRANNPLSSFYINKQSATTVIALHTTHNESFVYNVGLRYVVGHYDFYVYVAEGLDDYCNKNPSCFHQRSLNLFKLALEQIGNEEDRLVGFKCDIDVNKMDPVRFRPRAVFGLRVTELPALQNNLGVIAHPLHAIFQLSGVRRSGSKLSLPLTRVAKQEAKLEANVYYLPIGNTAPHNFVLEKNARLMKWCKLKPIKKGVTLTLDLRSLAGKRREDVYDIEFKSESEAPAAKLDKEYVTPWENYCKVQAPSESPIKVEAVLTSNPVSYRNVKLYPDLDPTPPLQSSETQSMQGI